VAEAEVGSGITPYISAECSEFLGFLRGIEAGNRGQIQHVGIYFGVPALMELVSACQGDPGWASIQSPVVQSTLVDPREAAGPTPQVAQACRLLSTESRRIILKVTPHSLLI
jgi:hypothetical protein